MSRQANNSTSEFVEFQRLRQWYIWLAVLGLLFFFVYAFLQQVVLGVPVGENPMSNFMLIGTLVIVVAVVVTLLALQLRTTVNSDGVEINFSLFGRYSFAWRDVKRVSLINLGFMGYGYRISKQYGTVFNLGGKLGLMLELKNDKTYTVVIKNTQDLRKTLQKLKKI